MTKNRVNIGVGIDDQTQKALGNIIKSLGGVSGQLSILSGKFLLIKSGIQAALDVTGISRFTGAIKSLIAESTQLAARIETLGVVTHIIGKNAGHTAGEMDGFVNAVKKMGITTQEAQNTVIQLAQAQIDLTQASKLARVAQDAAVIGGINSSEALQRMMHGIMTLQPEILRNIGITVNFEQEYAKAARTLGKSVESLSAYEKKQIAVSAVLREGIKIQGAYEASMRTAGKQVTSLARYIEEAKLKFGELFKPAYTAIVFGVSDALSALNKELERLTNEGKIQEWADTFTDATQKVMSAIKALYTAVSTILKILWELRNVFIAVGVAIATYFILQLGVAMKGVVGAIANVQGLIAALRGLSIAFTMSAGPIGAIALAVGALSLAYLTLKDNVKKTEEQIDQTREKFRDKLKSFSPGDGVSESEAVTVIRKSLEQRVKELQAERRAMVDAMNDLTASPEDRTAAAKKYSERLPAWKQEYATQLNMLGAARGVEQEKLKEKEKADKQKAEIERLRKEDEKLQHQREAEDFARNFKYQSDLSGKQGYDKEKEQIRQKYEKEQRRLDKMGKGLYPDAQKRMDEARNQELAELERKYSIQRTNDRLKNEIEMFQLLSANEQEFNEERLRRGEITNKEIAERKLASQMELLQKEKELLQFNADNERDPDKQKGMLDDLAKLEERITHTKRAGVLQLTTAERADRAKILELTEKDLLAQITAVDLAEARHEISKKDAVIQRATLKEALLLNQTTHLNQMSRQDDEAAWLAQLDVVQALRGEVIQLQQETKLYYGSFAEGFKDEMKGFTGEVVGMFKLGQDVARATAQSMSDSFSNLFFDMMKGELKSFEDYFMSVLDSIAKALSDFMAQQLVQQFFSAVFPSLMPGTSQVSMGVPGGATSPSNLQRVDNWFNTTSWGGPTQHTGGVINEGKASPIRAAATAFIRRHTGGPVPQFNMKSISDEEVPVFVAKQGEGVINPEGMRALADLNKGKAGKSGGGDVNVEINLQNQTGNQMTAKQGNMKFDGKKYIIGVILEDVAQGGPLKTALQGAR